MITRSLFRSPLMLGVVCACVVGIMWGVFRGFLTTGPNAPGDPAAYFFMALLGVLTLQTIGTQERRIDALEEKLRSVVSRAAQAAPPSEAIRPPDRSTH